MDEKVQFGLLLTWMALFSLFASRKFTQPIKVNCCRYAHTRLVNVVMYHVTVHLSLMFYPVIRGVDTNPTSCNFVVVFLITLSIFTSTEVGCWVWRWEQDDIGDKSVFMFNALPEESKQAVIARIQEEQSGKEKVE